MALLVKKTSVFIFSLLLFILTGCGTYINEREEAEKIVTSVIECINRGDSEGLSNLFCSDVKENYELSSETDKLFSLFDDEITSYEVSATSLVDKHTLFDESYTCIKAIAFAYTNDKEYRIEVSKTICHNQNSQRVGITTVMAKEENVKEMFFVGEINVFTN